MWEERETKDNPGGHQESLDAAAEVPTLLTQPQEHML